MPLFVLSLNGWPGYDHARGFVVRAPDETAARELATASELLKKNPGAEDWLNPGWATCDLLPVDGPEEIILEDNTGG